MSLETIQACRSCGAPTLETVLPLGEQPLANNLLRARDLGTDEPRFPLTLAACGECALGQILETVPPQTLFSDYVYFSSYSDGMLQHARESTSELRVLLGLDADDLVVEIASNDGYQLQYFQQAGIPVLGVEPATNVAKVANDRGIPTHIDFFSNALAHQLVADDKRAKLILGYNVLAHVPDLNGVVAGLRTLLTDDGIAVIEVPDGGRMVQVRAFDTIYHEHLCYFTLNSLCALFRRHDLEIFKVSELMIHGGSLRIYAAPATSQPLDPSVEQVLERERASGLTDLKTWHNLGRGVAELRSALTRLLEERRAAGRRLAAYGAAAKGSTLLNTFGLGANHIDFVVDRSPHKQGLYMPGARVPILDPEALTRKQPDDCLLLAWNFAEEILQQQKAFREAGGRFVIPLPELRVV